MKSVSSTTPIIELGITATGWERDYVQNVVGMVEKYGGRFLCRTNASNAT